MNYSKIVKCCWLRLKKISYCLFYNYLFDIIFDIICCEGFFLFKWKGCKNR